MDASGIEVATDVAGAARCAVRRSRQGGSARAPLQRISRRILERAGRSASARSRRCRCGTCARPSAEIEHALGGLKHQGVCLFASYGGKFLGDAAFDPVMEALNARDAVVFVHPALHPSSRGLELPWPGFMMEYLFDTTRAAVNLVFGGAIERFPRIRFVLAHAGGLIPYFAWRLSVSPMIDARLEQISPCARSTRGSGASGTTTRCRRRPRPSTCLAGRRFTQADRVRQRLAVRQRPRGGGGGEDATRRRDAAGAARLPSTGRTRLSLFPQFA